MKKSIFAVDMVKHLYIIAGCNGAGKTTASKTILPKSLLVKEFVNADEIAKGLSPFNPEGVADRVASGGHNIPLSVIERRYQAGLRNLFQIFMDEVDVWVIYDNSNNKGERVAFGGKAIPTKIKDKLNLIKLRAMSERDIEDFLSRVDAGLAEAQHNMLVEKALHNQNVVIADEQGKVQYVPAKDLLAEHIDLSFWWVQNNSTGKTINLW